MINRYEIEVVNAILDIDSLTTEATKITDIINFTLVSVNELVLAKESGNLTTENARSYLTDIATEADILDFESELTIESSYSSSREETELRSGAKIVDIVTKIFLMIYNAIKKFMDIFKRFLTKIRLANKAYKVKAEQLLKVIDNKLDISDKTITDHNLKEQVFDLIGAYAIQYDRLAVEDGIAGALNTPKDYGKLVNIISGLGKWNDSLLNKNVFNMNDFKKESDWGDRHEALLKSWRENVINKKVPSSLTKLSENMNGKIFGSNRNVTINGFGIMGYFENRLGASHLAFIPFGLDGKTIHMVTAYNQDVGKLIAIKAEVKYNIKDLEVQYPTITLMRKCLKDIIKNDYKDIEKDIMGVMKDIEKEFKSKIDTFMSDKIKNDSADQLHITAMLRGVYGGNINAINTVAMSIITHTLRNNNNLIKYIDLMSSQLENKPTGNVPLLAV